jgi:hypothetical protein
MRAFYFLERDSQLPYGNETIPLYWMIGNGFFVSRPLGHIIIIKTSRRSKERRIYG